MILAKNLKYLRKKAGLSTRALGDKTNTSIALINTIENEKHLNPTINTVLMFSSFFGVSIDDLIKKDLTSGRK